MTTPNTVRPATPAIQIRRLSKSFSRNTPVLKDVSLEVASGEMVALIGASGSGKSTLVRHIAGLVASDDAPEARVTIFGQDMQSSGRISANAADIRTDVGVVFQQFNLVPRLRVLTNVLMGHLGKMPWWRGALGLFDRDQKRKAMQALDRVGIADKALQRGSELSGGQQQRAAIARALVQDARLIVADEPIASLDPAASRRVMDTLRDLNQRDGITVVVSLHQVQYALAYCERAIALSEGVIVYDGSSEGLTTEFLKTLYKDESEDLLLGDLDRDNNKVPQESLRANVHWSSVSTVLTGTPDATDPARYN